MDLLLKITHEILTGCFGSVAVIQTNSSPMTGLGWKAAIQPGRMSAFTNTGHSEAPKLPKLNGSGRPAGAGEWTRLCAQLRLMGFAGHPDTG